MDANHNKSKTISPQLQHYLTDIFNTQLQSGKDIRLIYPSKTELDNIKTMYNVSPCVIMKWFNNKRRNHKRLIKLSELKP